MPVNRLLRQGRRSCVLYVLFGSPFPPSCSAPPPVSFPKNALARTPLNTMFLGLRLVIDDLATSRRAADKDRLDTLQDVVHACEVLRMPPLSRHLCAPPFLTGTPFVRIWPLHSPLPPPLGLLYRSP